MQILNQLNLGLHLEPNEIERAVSIFNKLQRELISRGCSYEPTKIYETPTKHYQIQALGCFVSCCPVDLEKQFDILSNADPTETNINGIDYTDDSYHWDANTILDETDTVAHTMLLAHYETIKLMKKNILMKSPKKEENGTNEQ